MRSWVASIAMNTVCRKEKSISYRMEYTNSISYGEEEGGTEGLVREYAMEETYFKRGIQISPDAPMGNRIGTGNRHRPFFVKRH